MSALRLVLVDWQDSVAQSGEWESLEKAEAPPALVCRSVGWLVAEGDETILIAPHVHDAIDELRTVFSGSGCMIIPQRAVVRIVDLEPRPAGTTRQRRSRGRR